jgi:ribosomal protein L24E
VALAAVTGIDPAVYENAMVPGGGMYTTTLEALLRRDHPELSCERTNRPLRHAIGHGRGILFVRSKVRVYHFIAFDEFMLYDINSDGRWMWWADHYCANRRALRVWRIPNGQV